MLLSVIDLFSQSIINSAKRDEFNSKTNYLDTVIEYKYFSGNAIKQKEIMYETKSTIEDSISSFLIYIKIEKYWKNGFLKKEDFFDKGLVLKEIYYDKKGQKSYEYIYEYDKPEAQDIYINEKKLKSHFSNSQTILMYLNGKLWVKKQYKENKKHGVWEYYDHNTGALKKTVTYDKGEKVSVNKLEL